MKHFNFGDFPGFPLDQDVLRDMQTSYFSGLEAFCKSFNAADYFVVGGCEYQPDTPTAGMRTINPGIIYHPTYGLCTFEGAVVGAVASKFTFQEVPNVLGYEDGDEVGMIDKKVLVSPATPPALDTLSADCARKWYTLLPDLFESSWVKFHDDPGNIELWYKHNKLTDCVHIKGYMKHNNTTAVPADNITRVLSNALPSAICPTYNELIVCTTSIYNQADAAGGGTPIRKVTDYMGNWYDRGTALLSNGADGYRIRLMCERLDDDYTDTLKHQIYFSYTK